MSSPNTWLATYPSKASFPSWASVVIHFLEAAEIRDSTTFTHVASYRPQSVKLLLLIKDDQELQRWKKSHP